MHNPNSEQLSPYIPNPKATTLHSRALDKLGQSMGYRLNSWNERDRKLVLADALSCIEKLKFGGRVTKRPREMEEQDVVMKLKKLVPEDQIVCLRGSKEYNSDIEILMLATSDYVVQLKAERAVADRELARIKEQREQLVSAAAVERALEKIDHWCDTWLDGEMKDTDWTTFGNCLD